MSKILSGGGSTVTDRVWRLRAGCGSEESAESGGFQTRVRLLPVVAVRKEMDASDSLVSEMGGGRCHVPPLL